MPEHAEQTFVFDDVEMTFTESGSPSGRVFVLVHGIGMSRRVMGGLADDLGRHGRILSVDLPGFGGSPRPRRSRSIEQLGDLMAEFQRAQGARSAVLVGHSMGAQIVAETAARHPALCESLVLIGPTVNVRERSALQQTLRLVEDLGGESPKVLALGTLQYLRTGPIWFTRQLRTMVRHHLEDTAPRIEAPALVLRGEEDTVCPRDWGMLVARLLPSGHLAEIPEHGHEAMIADPGPAATAIVEHVGRV